MNRRGFALLAVLWTLVALGAFTATAMLVAHQGMNASRNRLALVRGAWAQEACVEILEARYWVDRDVRQLDSVDLGWGAWCTASLEDPTSKLNLNVAAAGQLLAVLSNDSLVDALLDWRDPDTVPRAHGAEATWYRQAHRRPPRNASLESVGELHLVRGFDALPEGRLAELFTTAGSGRINLNGASLEVLRALGGDGEAIAAARAAHVGPWQLRNLDELLSAIPMSRRSQLVNHFQELAATTSFAPERFLLHAAGGVRGLAAIAQELLEVAPAGHRLAVLRREVP